MPLGRDAVALLEALSEPALLVGLDGVVEHANRAGRALLERDLVGRPLAEAHRGDAGALQLYISRCAGSRQPLVGALILDGHAPGQKFQCRGCLVQAENHRSVLLRLSRRDEVRFGALTRKVAELNAQVRERQSAQAKLEEIVNERELLLRELQHRVKNNMHMLAGVLAGAEREAGHPEAKAALRDAATRFSAVSAVQQLLYSSDSLSTVGAQPLVQTLTRALASMMSSKVRIETKVEPAELPVDVAVPLALMLNELLTNSLKYGQPATGAGLVRVELLMRDSELVLVVADNGPGFSLEETRKRASGLGLVRGLVRQLGGRFTVERHDGARSAVSIPDPGGRLLNRSAP